MHCCGCRGAGHVGTFFPLSVLSRGNSEQVDFSLSPSSVVLCDVNKASSSGAVSVRQREPVNLPSCCKARSRPLTGRRCGASVQRYTLWLGGNDVASQGVPGHLHWRHAGGPHHTATAHGCGAEDVRELHGPLHWRKGVCHLYLQIRSDGGRSDSTDTGATPTGHGTLWPRTELQRQRVPPHHSRLYGACCAGLLLLLPLTARAGI